MAKKENGAYLELTEAKMDMYKIRVRRAMGESVAPHVIKETRKRIAKCVKSLENSEVKDA